MSIKISQLWTYPIKSLPGISLTHSTLLAKGLEYDRNWMLVDENLNFMSQRKYPQMALINIAIEEYGLRLTHKDMPPMIVPWVNTEIETFQTLTVKIWNDECSALHINSAIDNWFGEILSIDCQLVYLPDENERYVDRDYAFNKEQTRFSDGFPLLLISEASLLDLASRIPPSEQIPLTMKNFRPNLVVSGCEPYAEDHWKNFSLKGVEFLVAKPCSRCIVTTIDPSTGVRSADQQPLKTLLSYRKKANKVLFGQNILFKYKLAQTLELGDSLTINDDIEGVL